MTEDAKRLETQTEEQDRQLLKDYGNGLVGREVFEAIKGLRSGEPEWDKLIKQAEEGWIETERGAKPLSKNPEARQDHPRQSGGLRWIGGGEVAVEVVKGIFAKAKAETAVEKAPQLAEAPQLVEAEGSNVIKMPAREGKEEPFLDEGKALSPVNQSWAGQEVILVDGTPYVPPQEPLVALNDINRNHAVITNLGGKCVVMEWVPSLIAPGTMEPSYQRFTTFRERYGNRYVKEEVGKGKTQEKELGTWWLKNPMRRQFDGIALVAVPQRVLPGNRLNLWRGFGVKPEPGDWKLIERHIYEVIANGDQGFYDYTIRWIAWKFQNADQQPKVALVSKGKKGVGKGVLGVVLLKSFGPHGIQVFNPDHVVGKHNLHLQNKLFLHADEALWAGDKQAERTLKGMITEATMTIEPKGIDAFQWPNLLGMLLTANEKWVVPASPDERRYAVQNASDKYRKNDDYFNRVFEQIDNGGVAAMLYDLLRMDLGDWHPRQDVPQNAALVEQKVQSLDGLDGWFMAKLSLGELPNAFPKNPRQSLSCNLKRDAQDHNPKNKYLTETEFGLYLRKEVGCEHKSTGKAWSWIFPPLADCRKAFEVKLGGSCEWISQIEDWAHGGGI
jgi:hypothetical protein